MIQYNVEIQFKNSSQGISIFQQKYRGIIFAKL